MRVSECLSEKGEEGLWINTIGGGLLPRSTWVRINPAGEGSWPRADEGPDCHVVLFAAVGFLGTGAIGGEVASNDSLLRLVSVDFSVANLSSDSRFTQCFPPS